jgi:uncharacterized glyoxalase superfamily protein PhnB
MPANFSPDILVTDVARSARFLTEALGFQELDRMGPPGAPVWAALVRDGHRVMIESHKTPDPDTRAMVEAAGNRLAATVHFYVSVDDLDAEIARLRAARVAFDGPEVKPYGMKEIRFKDPDGYSWMVGVRVEQK